MSSPAQVEHILSPAPQNITMTSTPPLTSGGTDQAAVKEGAKIKGCYACGPISLAHVSYVLIFCLI